MGAWQCGSGCFSNKVLYRNVSQWFFFFKKKLFLTSAYQNDPKHTNHIKF